MPLVDDYGRRLTTLRIAVTDRCNLRCIYCHREGEDYSVGVNGDVDIDELASIVSIGAELGLSRVKITGGEPLLRKDIVDLVYRLSSLDGIEEVSMTTNGVLLSDYAYKLKEVGLKRINITVNTINKETYRIITGFNLLDRVLDGVESAVDAGLTPIKVNMVLLKDLNEDDVPSMIEYAANIGAVLQVIEFEKVGVVDNELYGKLHASLDRVETLLSRIAVAKYYRSSHARPRYVLPNGVVVELVKPMHNPTFCKYCDRLRVTSRGELKPCLLRCDNHVNIVEAIRCGASREDLKKLFLLAIARRKPYFE